MPPTKRKLEARFAHWFPFEVLQGVAGNVSLNFFGRANEGVFGGRPG